MAESETFGFYCDSPLLDAGVSLKDAPDIEFRVIDNAIVDIVFVKHRNQNV